MNLNHVESILPKGKKWKLVWHDEFDGTELDLSKWSFRRHLLHRRFETYTDRAVWLDGNSIAHFQVLEKDGHYCNAALEKWGALQNTVTVILKIFENFIH